MNGRELSRLRREWELTLDEMAEMLGFDGEHRRSQVHDMECDRRPIRPAQERLLIAYSEGYRPADWPE